MDSTCTSGAIESIILKNFMCHDNLVVMFKSGVNVINGPNGSGKSAILTALIFVLGSRASVTSRAHSHKDFIKLNRQSASVTITICNTGGDPYKPDTYGDKIIIQRKVSQSGVTTFKILEENNKIISRSREELVNITEHFSIHVDNPINILNQESSKTFLTTSNPKVKYKLFMHATNLQDMLDHYEQSKLRQQSIQSDLDNKMRSMLDLKDHVDSLSAKIKSLDDFEKIGERIISCENKLISRQILDMQNEREHNQDSLVKETQRLVESKTLLEEMKKTANVLRSEYAHLSTRCKAYEEEILKYDEMVQGISNKRSEMTNILDRKITVSNRFKADIKNMEMLYNERLKVMESRVGSEIDIVEHRKQLQSKEQLISSQIEECTKESYECEETVKKIASKIQEYNRSIVSVRENISQLKQEINDKRRKIERYISSEKDKLLLYGEFTPKAMQMINEATQAGQFEHRPIGPIGFCISVKDKKWQLAIELCLKNALFSYIAFSFKDKSLLMSIFKKICQPNTIPSIFICDYRNTLYDTDVHAPRSEYPTILKLIQVNDVNVMNVLVDQYSIERILCIENVSDAKSIMIPKPPENVLKAYTIDGDEIITSNNQSRFYSSSQKYPKILSDDNKSAIKGLEEECQKLESEMDILSTSRMVELQEKLKQYQEQNLKEKERFKSIQPRVNKFTKDLEQIRNEIESINLADIMDIQKETEEYKNVLDSYSQQYNDVQQEIQGIHKKIAGFQQEIKNYDAKLALVTEELHACEKSTSQKDRELNLVERKLKKKTEEINACEIQIGKLKEKIYFADEQIANKTRLLSHEGLIDVQSTVEDIQAELNKLKIMAKNIKITPKEAAMIRKEYETISETYNTQQAKVKNLLKFNSQLKKMIAKRMKKYLKMRDFLSKSTKFRFKSLLMSRGYDGNLEFDHDATKLTISVNPSKDVSSSLGDSKCLSGGERSFSTLSLIVSLWEIIDCPFRCLDEFDVFMDIVNRRTGIKLLVEFAKDHPDQQIILITPQEIGDLWNREGVNIFKLDDPR